MDRLRTPFLVIALILLAVVVLIEIGSSVWLGGHSTEKLPTPGMGVPSLALVDGILLYTLGFFGLALVVPARVLGAVQGIVTFVAMLMLFIGSAFVVLGAVLLLTLMVTLLLAVPFGTIAYLAAFSTFEINAARATLGTLMALKVAAAVLLVLAQQRFLTVKGLVALLLTSFLSNIVVSFLHALVPMFLVSILDALGAIVVGVLAAIWSLVKLVGAVPAIVKGLRIDRHLS